MHQSTSVNYLDKYRGETKKTEPVLEGNDSYLGITYLNIPISWKFTYMIFINLKDR